MFDKFSGDSGVKILTFHCSECDSIGIISMRDSGDNNILCEKCTEKLSGEECGNCYGALCGKCLETKAKKCDKCKEIVCTECQDEKLIDGSNVCKSCVENDPFLDSDVDPLEKEMIMCDICFKKYEFNCRDEILATFGSCSSCSRDLCEKCCEQGNIRSCLECEKAYCIECVDEKIPNMKICIDCGKK
jgi:hypothetical protein